MAREEGGIFGDGVCLYRGGGSPPPHLASGRNFFHVTFGESMEVKAVHSDFHQKLLQEKLSEISPCLGVIRWMTLCSKVCEHIHNVNPLELSPTPRGNSVIVDVLLLVCLISAGGGGVV